MSKPRLSIHWFRRDLRLADNHGLCRALMEHGDVLPLFIFDTRILHKLEKKADRRVDFIHRTLTELHTVLSARGSTILIEIGDPLEVWKRLLERYTITGVCTNHDHEPYALERDTAVGELLKSKDVPFRTFKDISIFERGEVVKEDGSPYTVFTPYARKWRAQFEASMMDAYPSERYLGGLAKMPPLPIPTLEAIGFQRTNVEITPVVISDEMLRSYAGSRNRPDLPGTSRMSVHLRFGTVSVRELLRRSEQFSPAYVNELIWREFFMQILWHFPNPHKAFKPAYDAILWRSDQDDFNAWCEGRTGYPLVDAGMRELAATGLMHNRVRMVVASFLCKHLVLDWRWGEAWFAAELLDLELSSNNGNWQWAAGCGCDAAPYFRVFNPTLQQKRFDPKLNYVKKWVPEYGSANYVRPIVVHEVARQRALATYKKGLSGMRGRIDELNDLFS